MPAQPPTDEIIRPIGQPSEEVKAAGPLKPQPPRSLARDVDRLVAAAALLTALATFGLSAYFFYGFTRTDSGLWTLLSSFGLCFFVGALAYVPSFLLWRIARASAQTSAQASAHQAASRKQFAAALLLMLPWVCLSLVFIGASAMPKRYGFLALGLSLLFSYWAFIRLKAAPKLTKA